MKASLFIPVGIALSLLFASGCSSDDDTIPHPHPASTDWPLIIKFNVDGVPLVFDTLLYQNAAGNVYGVNMLHFYLSSFEFTAVNGSKVNVDTVLYIDARNPGNPFALKGVPWGAYSKVTFYIGLDSAHNISNSLPATIQNMNMAWPELMGGGYHFMKLEGIFGTSPDVFGYAMHLGTNNYNVPVEINRNLLHATSADKMILDMNINEWFANPAAYDFNVDDNYSMGNDSAMAKLANNGRDVFN